MRHQLTKMSILITICSSFSSICEVLGFDQLWLRVVVGEATELNVSSLFLLSSSDLVNGLVLLMNSNISSPVNLVSSRSALVDRF